MPFCSCRPPCPTIFPASLLKIVCLSENTKREFLLKKQTINDHSDTEAASKLSFWNTKSIINFYRGMGNLRFEFFRLHNNIFSSSLYSTETCRCEKEVRITKRAHLPLITTVANDTFTELVDFAIKTCCSTCSGKNIATLWKTDANGNGIFNDEEVLEKLQFGHEVYVPQLHHLHTRNRPKRRYALGTFIPVLKSPGIAVLVKQKTAIELASVEAWVLVKSLLRTSPLLIISIMVLILLGYLQWLNVSEFPP